MHIINHIYKKCLYTEFAKCVKSDQSLNFLFNCLSGKAIPYGKKVKNQKGLTSKILYIPGWIYILVYKFIIYSHPWDVRPPNRDISIFHRLAECRACPRALPLMYKGQLGKG